MTTKSSSNSELKGLGGQRVALVSVRAIGELTGLALRMKVRQVYRNTTEDNLETVYTFPLAWGTTLLGLKVEINGRTMSGSVIGKAEAEQRYEQAIEDGDTPVMLEWAGKDLYTANLGNLMPDDEAVIEIEYGQLLSVKNGSLRIAMPCTLAPRYGEKRTFAETASLHFYEMNPLSEYRFHLNLTIPAPFTQGRISCPSHSISQSANGANLLIKLNRKAMLDRDFVLKIENLDGLAFSTICADPAVPWQHIALTSFSPEFAMPREARKMPLNLKILIDCSGSMAGDSMAQARSALSALIDELGVEDAVSFSKFGNQTANVLGELASCSPDYIDDLKEEIHHIDATMGGTEMNRAINRVMSIKDERGELPESASVLLITDGEVWDIDGIVATVRHAKHRIFAVGVGSAPAESLLQDLSSISGGYCSMVSPKEDMRSTVMDLVSRMRSSAFLDVNVRYDAQPIWQSPNPFIAMSGDTIHHWSRLSSAPTNLTELSWSSSSDDSPTQRRRELSAPSLSTDADGTLARMLAAQHLLDITDEQIAREIALKYQLITRFTNFFLVFQRESGDKPCQLPTLQQIEHMQGAGWMGASTVFESQGYMAAPVMFRTVSAHISSDSSMVSASVWRTSRTSVRSRRKPQFSALSQVLANPLHADNPIKILIESMNGQSMHSNNFKQAWRMSMYEDAAALMNSVIGPLAKDGVAESCVWAALLIWLSTEKGFKPILERFAMRLSRGEIAKITAEQRRTLIEAFEAEAEKPAPPISRAPAPLSYLAENMGDDDKYMGEEDHEIPAFLRKQAD